jgi:hypothetical protein
VILESLIALLTDPQGSLAYHLISTFTIGLIFLLALAQRRRAGSISLRWSIASGPLAAARLGMLLLTASTVLGAPELAPMLSPLDRYLAVAGGLVLGWAFLFPVRSGMATGRHCAGGLFSGLAVSALPLAQAGRPVGCTVASPDLAGLLAMSRWSLLLVRRPISWPAAAGGPALLAWAWPATPPITFRPNLCALRIAELLAYPRSARRPPGRAIPSTDRSPPALPRNACKPMGRSSSRTTLKGWGLGHG